MSHTLILQVSKILHKVILYPNPDPNPEVSSTSYVVLDYYRPSLPCSVQDTIVLVYPETNDMVQVSGSNDETNPEVSATSYVVLDYHRPSLPCSVQDTIVPVYPETNDMVQVCGSNDETWLGRVITVDNVNKTCTLNFYVEDLSCPGRFKQESFGHLSVNTVHWESITSVCEGN